MSQVLWCQAHFFMVIGRMCDVPGNLLGELKK